MVNPLKDLDKETRVILTDGEKIQSLVQHEGWAIAKKKLQDRLMDVGNIMTLGRDKDGNISTPEKVFAELAARQMTLESVFDWLRDIEGDAEQTANHVHQMREVMEESHLFRVEDSKGVEE